MCGHVGVAGRIWANEEKALKTLLILDSVRGTDSTGAAFISKMEADVRVAKHLGDPFQLFDSKRFEDTMKGSHRAIIGHNRFATQGAINSKNAHPFEFDTLVGAHNGTLTNKWRLEDNTKFAVDSENLFHHIEKNGLRNAMDIALGAWALVWWDKIEGTMNFLRNNQRPLFLAYTKKGDTLFWASESWMLQVAVPRHNLDLGDIWELPVDQHMVISVDHTGALSKPRLTEMKQKEVAVVQTPFHQQAQRHLQLAGGTKTSQAATTTTSATTTSSSSATLKGITDKFSETRSNDSTDSKKNSRATSSGGRTFYVNTKDAEFELVAIARDTNGATFIQVFDYEAADKDVRLYLSRHGMENLVQATRENNGRKIIASVKDIKIHKKEGTFYKLAAATVKLVPVEAEKKEEEADDPPFEFGEPPLLDHRGKEITDEDFISEYGECAYCTGFVDPALRLHRFTKSNNAVCGECATDPELNNYMSFVD